MGDAGRREIAAVSDLYTFSRNYWRTIIPTVGGGKLEFWIGRAVPAGIIVYLIHPVTCV